MMNHFLMALPHGKPKRTNAEAAPSAILASSGGAGSAAHSGLPDHMGNRVNLVSCWWIIWTVEELFSDFIWRPSAVMQRTYWSMLVVLRSSSTCVGNPAKVGANAVWYSAGNLLIHGSSTYTQACQSVRQWEKPLLSKMVNMAVWLLYLMQITCHKWLSGRSWYACLRIQKIIQVIFTVPSG